MTVMTEGMRYVIALGILALLQGVTVAIIGGWFKRESKRRKTDDEEMEKRAAIRMEESLLAMSLMSAITRLSCASALALKEGRTNGKMDMALADAEKAQSEYYAFINRVASERVTAD